MTLQSPRGIEGPIRATERGANVVKEYFDGGLVRATLGLRPISYLENGAYREISNGFVNSGIVGREHIVTDSPMWVSSGDGGTRRIHPTRENDVYLEIGRPHNVSTRQPYPMNPLVRSGNLLTSTNTNANLYIWHAGHYSKVGIELKAAWKTSPPPQIAFPVTLSGLTWNQGVVYKNGAAVMHLSAPVAYDMSNELTNRRMMRWDFVQLAGQWYVVLDLPTAAQMSGWSRPVIDPTFNQQDAEAASTDTYIETANPSSNYGSSAYLAIGNDNTAPSYTYRTLIKPDFSSLPSAAAISSAQLKLKIEIDRSNTARIGQLFRQKRVWTENGATNVKYDASNNWQTAGGFGVDDCEQTAIGSCSFGAADTGIKTFVITASTKSDLDLGNGWLLKMQVESYDAYILASANDPTAADRPEIIIVYSLQGLLPKLMQFHNRRRQ